VLLSHVVPDRLERSASIRVVVLPRVVNASKPRIRPAPKGQVLLALGTSSLIEIPSRGVASFAKLAKLVEQLPTFLLELGRDSESIPGCVERLLPEANRL